MKRTLITISLFLIIVGVIAVSLNMAMGNQTSVLIYGNRQPNGYIMWHFDLKNYIQNIELSITNTTQLALSKPTREWIDNVDLSLLEEEYWQAVLNNMALALDWLLFVINIIIYPFRIGGYVLRNALVIIGINQNTDATQNGLAWLIELTNFLISLQINYV